MAMNTAAGRHTIEMSRPVPVPFDAAVAVMKHAPWRAVTSAFAASWTGGDPEAGVGVDLPGGVHVERTVRVGFGSPFQEDDAFVTPVWWQAAQHPQRYPTFDGAFELRPQDGATEIRLTGGYRPPFGSIGRIADGVVGHRIVLASLETLLAAAADRLAGATEIR